MRRGETDFRGRLAERRYRALREGPSWREERRRGEGGEGREDGRKGGWEKGRMGEREGKREGRREGVKNTDAHVYMYWIRPNMYKILAKAA